jgi:hypothetical protein
MVSRINGPRNHYDKPTIYGYWALALSDSAIAYMGTPSNYLEIGYQAWPGFGPEDEEALSRGKFINWFGQSTAGWYDQDDWLSRMLKFEMHKVLISESEPLPKPEWFEPFDHEAFSSMKQGFLDKIPPAPIYVPHPQFSL